MIEYRNQIFRTPIPTEDDDYAGPATPERNARWRALHQVGNTRLSKAEASRLHNKTAAAQAGTDEDYPIVLNVFHDLHCLVRICFRIPCSSPLKFDKDSIRIAFDYLRDPDWNSTYNPYTVPWPGSYEGSGPHSTAHAHHCFNSIRQALQCSSDVTPVVFKYYSGKDQIRSNFDVLHTCRNFDAVCESHYWHYRATLLNVQVTDAE